MGDLVPTIVQLHPALVDFFSFLSFFSTKMIIVKRQEKLQTIVVFLKKFLIGEEILDEKEV
jgi:hypothetical protein